MRQNALDKFSQSKQQKLHHETAEITGGINLTENFPNPEPPVWQKYNPYKPGWHYSYSWLSHTRDHDSYPTLYKRILSNDMGEILAPNIA